MVSISRRPAGLDRLTAEEYARFHVLNAAYRERFAKPPVICLSVSSNQTYFRTGNEHPLTVPTGVFVTSDAGDQMPRGRAR